MAGNVKTLRGRSDNAAQFARLGVVHTHRWQAWNPEFLEWVPI